MEKIFLLIVGLFFNNVCVVYSKLISNRPWLSCCTYCRSDPAHWITVKGTFKLSCLHSACSMMLPPAYMINEEAVVAFDESNTDYRLAFSGVPMLIATDDANDAKTLLEKQYMQIDMSNNKLVSGLYLQGGRYEEKIKGKYPLTETWVTEFVLSYSNDSVNFNFLRDRFGSIQRFTGAKDSLTKSKLHAFNSPIVTRLLRFHPLQAESTNGVTNKVNVRVTVVTCSEEPCETVRINCLMSIWTQWTECTCTGSKCTQTRDRSIRRPQSCGGENCDVSKDTKVCVPVEPLWQSIVQYGGIALAAVVLIAVVSFCIYKRTHKERVEVILVGEHDSDDEDDARIVENRRKAQEAAFVPPPSVAPAAAAFPMGRAPVGYGFGPRPGFGGPMAPGAMGPGAMGPGGFRPPFAGARAPGPASQ